MNNPLQCKLDSSAAINFNQVQSPEKLPKAGKQTSNNDNKSYLKDLLNKHNVLRFVSSRRRCVWRTGRQWRSCFLRVTALRGAPWVAATGLRYLQRIKNSWIEGKNSFQNLLGPSRATTREMLIINASGSCFASNHKLNTTLETLDVSERIRAESLMFCHRSPNRSSVFSVFWLMTNMCASLLKWRVWTAIESIHQLSRE